MAIEFTTKVQCTKCTSLPKTTITVTGLNKPIKLLIFDPYITSKSYLILESEGMSIPLSNLSYFLRTTIRGAPRMHCNTKNEVNCRDFARFSVLSSRIVQTVELSLSEHVQRVSERSTSRMKIQRCAFLLKG
jgi:hypothetical protein